MLFIKRSTVVTTAKVATRTVLSWDLALPIFPGTLARILSSGEEVMPKIQYLNAICEIVVLSLCVTG